MYLALAAYSAVATFVILGGYIYHTNKIRKYKEKVRELKNRLGIDEEDEDD